MKKLLLLFTLFGSLTANAQICTMGVTSVDFSPIAGTDDLQLDIHSSCCEIHSFQNFTITSSGSNQ